MQKAKLKKKKKQFDPRNDKFEILQNNKRKLKKKNDEKE